MADFKNTDAMKDLTGFFKPGQRTAIYNACQSERDKLLIRLLWKSGRRIGEILALKVEDIDFENGNILWHIEKKCKKLRAEDGQFITWFDKKGKKHYKTQRIDLKRLKPQDKRTLKELEIYVNKNWLLPKDYVFEGAKENTPITRQRAFQIVRDAAEDAGLGYIGIKKPHPHHFRHSFAVDIAKRLKSPGDLRKLQMAMEHTNLDMTQNYLQFGQTELRELMENDDDS